MVIVQADVERILDGTLPCPADYSQNYLSLGIHPWDVERYNINEVFNRFVNNLQNDENHRIAAIGECGLDKLCTSPLDLQKEVFIKHVELSERFGLPIIVHCVKAMDELLRIRREMRPTLPWIWHGFRGKPEQMRQLLDAGMYISFGFKHNAQSMDECPAERMLFETDCDERPVSLLYEQTGKMPSGMNVVFSDL